MPQSTLIINLKQNDNAYDWFTRDVFYETQEEWDLAHTGLFGNVDCKKFLEDYFKIKL